MGLPQKHVTDDPKVARRLVRANRSKAALASWHGTPRLEAIARLRHQGTALALAATFAALKAGIDPDEPAPTAAPVNAAAAAVRTSIDAADLPAALLALPDLTNALRAHANAVGLDTKATDELVSQLDLAIQQKDSQAAKTALDAILEGVLAVVPAEPKTGPAATAPAAGPPMKASARAPKDAEFEQLCGRAASARELMEAQRRCTGSADRDVELRFAKAKADLEKYIETKHSLPADVRAVMQAEGVSMKEVLARKAEISPLLWSCVVSRSALFPGARPMTSAVALKATRDGRRDADRQAFNATPAGRRKAEADRIETRMRAAAEESERFARWARETDDPVQRIRCQRLARGRAEKYETLKTKLQLADNKREMAWTKLATAAPKSPLPPDQAAVAAPMVALGEVLTEIAQAFADNELPIAPALRRSLVTALEEYLEVAPDQAAAVDAMNDELEAAAGSNDHEATIGAIADFANAAGLPFEAPHRIAPMRASRSTRPIAFSRLVQVG